MLTAADTNRLLLNGGFEVGQGTEFGEWLPYGPGSLANVGRDPVTANARSGTQCLKMYGAFNGADNSSGLYQDLPVAPGEIWQASIWARNRPGDLLQGNNQALLKLEYLDSLGNVLAGQQVITAKTGSPTNYEQFALRREAPANAAFARLVLEFKQFASAAGAVNLDDAQLQRVTAQTGAAVLNHSFEYQGNTSFPNWTAYGNGANVLLDAVTNHARTGSSAVRMFGQSTSALNNSGLFQDVPATEGQVWQVGVWGRNRLGDLLQGDNYGQSKLEYLNANGLVLTRSQLTTITAASATNYQRFAVVRAAPPGTVKARVVLEMVQVNFAGGSVVYDDAEMIQIPNLTGAQGAGRVLWDGSLQPNGIVNFEGDLVLSSTLTNLEVVLSGTNAGLNFPQLQVAGTATLGGQVRVVIPTSGGGIGTNTFFIPRSGQSFPLVTAGTRSNTFASLIGPPALGGGGAFVPDYQSNGVALRVVAELDTDSDGLPDYWEAAYFNSPLNANAAFDTDGDGLANLAEFTADTNPTNSASVFRILQVAVDGSGVSLSYQSSSNRKYTLTYADTPASGSWSNVVSQTDIPGVGGIQTLTDPNANGQRRFYRVGVKLP